MKKVWKSKKIVVASILLFNIVASLTSLSFAWFINNQRSSINGEASINKSYFEGGDGSIGDPYLIKYPIQFYYFSWLQDMGYFNHEDEDNPGHFKQYHFELIDNIDMVEYHLPPAGSIKYPFIGSFDGNGYTISDISITNSTSIYTDEPENPYSDERNYQIMGVFGVVGEYGTMDYTFNSQINYIKDVNLTNVTINSTTPKNNQTLMGLLAGYVHDNLSDSVDTIDNVIVSGTSTITSSATSSLALTSHLSDYTLIGYTNKTGSAYLENVEVKTPVINATDGGSSTAIIDDSDGSGGDLVVAPSGLTDGNGNTLYDAFGSDVTSGSRPVDGAAPIPESDPEQMSAYYFSVMKKRTPSPQPTSFYEYTGATSTEFSGSKKQINIDTRSARTINSGSSDDEGFKTFMNYIDSSGDYRLNSQFVGLRPDNSPVFTGITNFTKYPTNCIWFKPLNTGHCFISFGVEKMNTSSNVSIYRYKRNASGAYTGLQELELYFNKTNKLGNGSIALFDLYISDIDYEYCIGKSSSSTDNPAYFFFLKLAGTDSQGGTGIPESVQGADYATYEQIVINKHSTTILEGVSFISDTSSLFQLNTINQSYVFSSEENMATINQTPGIGASVSRPGYTPYGNAKTIQIITGYDENGVVNLVMKKITYGITVEYYYKTSSSDPFTETTESVIGRYFGQSAIFSNVNELEYHHQIGSSSDEIIPTTSVNVTNVDDTYSIGGYTVSTTVNKQNISIDYINNLATFALLFMAGDGQIYP